MTNKYFFKEFELAMSDNKILNDMELLGSSPAALSGGFWKLGCNWGRGKPSFYQLLKKHSIVIGVDHKKYVKGDIILVSEGYTVKALAQILEAPVSIINRPDLQEEFLTLQIDYQDWICYADVLFIELQEKDIFQYKLQQGICRVQNREIRIKALNTWSKLNNLLSTESNIQMIATKIDYAKNTILYGPPGTGKTFRLNIIKEIYFTSYEIEDEKNISLKEIATSNPLWKIVGAILATATKPLAVTEIVVHPLIKARPKPSSKSKPNAAVWSDLQSYADDASTQLAEKYRRAIKLFHKDEKSQWSITVDKKSELASILGQDLLDIALDPNLKAIKENNNPYERYDFVTFHQKYAYEDFIEGIKPVLTDGVEGITSNELQFELKKGIFYNSCLKALNLAGYSSFDECYNDSFDNRKEKFNSIKDNEKKQFAIFIDEINRANISAVFGELITLLEEDKRIGQVHNDGIPSETWIKLPTSNEFFCVPPNLYVIGTMNTADRSIALLDIALRRRFEFVRLYPEYGTEWWTPLLKKLNESIYNTKRNPDFFIGHAFFINKDESEKSNILNKKIVPLLYEYYQNNIEKIKAILKHAEISFEEPSLDNNYQIIVK